jgi:DNA repair protein RecO (recombination protein O)
MPVSRLYKTEALVLKGVPFGEADILLTLFSVDSGQLRVIAKGARKPSSKLVGHVEPLTRSLFFLSRGRNLDILNQAEIEESFLPIRMDLDKMSMAIYLSELVEAFTGENAPNEPLYDLTIDTLRYLASTNASVMLLRYFEFCLLGVSGYLPELHCCVMCRSNIVAGRHFFSSRLGGILCVSCSSSQTESLPLSVDALKVLRYFSQVQLVDATKLSVSKGLAKELRDINQSSIRDIVARDIRSERFVDLLSSCHQRPFDWDSDPASGTTY